MSTIYGELGTFWPTPYGNVARVISGFVGGYGVAGGGGRAGFPVVGGYLFGSFIGIVNSEELRGHLPEYLFLWPLAPSGLLLFLQS